MLFAAPRATATRCTRTGGTSSVARVFSTSQREGRDQFLRRVVYKRYWEAGEAERKQLASKGELFAEHWGVFRSRATQHAELIADARYARLLPLSNATRKIRISSSLASRLTAASCHLEGSTMTLEDVRHLQVPADLLDCEALLSSPPTRAAALKLRRSTREVDEAYYHMVALYHGQALTLHRPTFYVTQEELLAIHSVLMHPFTEKMPGKLRQVPIQVSGWPDAYFPFAQELPGLTTQFAAWLRAPPCEQPTHPFLRACDIFLVMAHLHPFMDGNGRMARLLASLAMAHAGCEPAALEAVSRSEYARVVHAAQHQRRVCDFYRFCLDHALP